MNTRPNPLAPDAYGNDGLPNKRITETPLHRPAKHCGENYKAQVRKWYDYVAKQITKKTFYAVKRNLGEGGQGRAMLLEHRDKSLVVGKIFRKESQSVEEAEILQSVGEHENIVAMRDLLECNLPISRSRVLLLEYCDLGSVFDYRNRRHENQYPVPEGMIWHITLSLSRALAWMHSGYDSDAQDLKELTERDYTFVHRDVKPENILLKADASAPFGICIKLGDFGLAQKLNRDGEGWENVCYSGGTPDWQPLEAVQPPHIAGPEQDMWAVGAVIHYLALGEPPISVRGASNLFERGSEEWKRSIPRRVVRISSRPDLRYGLGHHGHYMGDGNQDWSIKYSIKLNRWMMRLLKMEAEERVSAVEVAREMPRQYTFET